MKNSVKIAFCGIVTAFVCVIMTASLIPNITLAVPAVAGLFLIPVIAEAGVVPALLCFAASGTLSFFTGNKTSWFLFVIFFGYYPVIRCLIEKNHFALLKWILKLSVFNAAAVICLVVQYNTVGLSFKGWYLALAFVLGNIVFLIYDVAVSRLSALYYLRFHKRISSMLGNKK